jgi:signal transduction histidine kinase
MYSNEANIYSAILVAASVLALILTFFIISLLRQRKKTDQLHREKINAEIATLENERKRVAGDLHDEVAMTLSVAKLQLSGIDALAPEDQKLVIKACEHIDNSLIKIREIVSDLLPTALTRKGLFAALQELFNAITDSGALTIHFSVVGQPAKIPDPVSIHIFRIVQEIVHNVIRHSGASVLNCTFTSEPNCLRCVISDNGNGFNEKHVVQQNSGLGLRSIMSRIELLNGIVYLDTGENKGVSYEIEIPLIA